MLVGLKQACLEVSDFMLYILQIWHCADMIIMELWNTGQMGGAAHSSSSALTRLLLSCMSCI